MNKLQFVISKVLLGALMVLSISTHAKTADDRYPIVRESKMGFIDYQGREVIPPRFSNAGGPAHFNNGLAAVFEAYPSESMATARFPRSSAADNPGFAFRSQTKEASCCFGCFV